MTDLDQQILEKLRASPQPSTLVSLGRALGTDITVVQARLKFLMRQVPPLVQQEDAAGQPPVYCATFKLGSSPHVAAPAPTAFGAAVARILSTERLAKKQCDACERVLLISQFEADRRGGDGLKHICRDCQKQERDAMKLSQQQREALDASAVAKATDIDAVLMHCQRCDARKAASDMVMRRGKASNTCKACFSIAVAKAKSEMAPALTPAKPKVEESVVLTSRVIRCTREAGGGITIQEDDANCGDQGLTGLVTLTGAELKKLIAFVQAEA